MPTDRRRQLLLRLLLPALLIGSPVRSQEEEPVLGAPAALQQPNMAAERIEVQAGTPLYREPDFRSMALVRIDAVIELEILERRGEWTLVHFGAWRGWIHPRPPSPYPAETGALSVPSPSPTRFEIDLTRERLERAATILGRPPEPVPWGTFQLLSDVEDPRLLAHTESIAAGLADTYRKRFGVDPGAAPNGRIVLFRLEEDYRNYENRDPELMSLDVRGHAAGDLALLFVGQGNLEETSSILIHELTHLLNRRALGPQLAPWLEEGLANDLSFTRVNRHGELDLGSLNGRVRTTETPVRTRRGTQTWYSFTISGATAALTRLASRIDDRQVSPLSELFDLSWSAFVRTDHRQANYSLSTFVVRYLLDGDKGRHADGFRRYLAGLQNGGGGDAETLLRHLDTPLPELQQSFEKWVRRQAAAVRF